MEYIMNLTDPAYKQWLTELKGKIRSVQLKAVISVNSALIQFYWELGKMISGKQAAWGSKLLETLSRDLQDEFREMKVFSVSNLKTCNNDGNGIKSTKKDKNNLWSKRNGLWSCTATIILQDFDTQ
jgi:hypothetical protein